MISIAIDGPSGAGKSSLSRRLAGALGFLYVDTGALYRTIGLAALQAGIDPKDQDAVAALLPHIELSMRHVNGEQRVFVEGEDGSRTIRQEKVSMAASAVSAHVPVRQFLLDTQRRLARQQDVIMDGRDIGTVVLPDADIKVFLTATVDDRANRRFLQLAEDGQQSELSTIRQDIEQRDYNDTHRPIAPLCQAEDAVRIDTSGLDVEQGYQKLYDHVAARVQALRGKNGL